MKTVLGLGNPGKEYEWTRHNAGRMVARHFAEKLKFSAEGGPASGWKYDKKSDSLVSKKGQVVVALPETFMNKSWQAAAKLIRSKKELKELIVVHDDLDLPLGRFKISYGKSSGGHKGVESVMRALKTKNFVRIRIGVSPKRKPEQKEVMKFIVGKFKPAELEVFKKVIKKVSEALEIILTDSIDHAMSLYNK